MWFNPGYLMQLDRREWTPSDGSALPGPASRPELPRRFDEYPCAGLVSEIESGTVRALLVVGGNPLTALPDTARTTRALRGLDLLVVVDVIETDTTPLATHCGPPPAARAGRPALAARCLPTRRCEPVHSRRGRAGARSTPCVADVRRAGCIAGRVGPTQGIDLADATDETLIERIGQGSRGGADALFAARHGTVHSGAVFGWVIDRVLPDHRWRVAPAPLIELLTAVENARADETLVLIPHRQLRKMNSQLRDVAAPGGRVDDIWIRSIRPTPPSTAWSTVTWWRAVGARNDERAGARRRHDRARRSSDRARMGQPQRVRPDQCRPRDRCAHRHGAAIGCTRHDHASRA
jgi:hypothetical protein